MNKDKIIRLLPKVIFALIIFSAAFAIGYFIEKNIQEKKISDLLLNLDSLDKKIENLNRSGFFSINDYPKEDTLSFDEFIKVYSKKKNPSPHFNYSGEIEYNDKIILNSDAVPLTYTTAKSVEQMKLIFDIEGVDPEICKENNSDDLCVKYNRLIKNSGK